MNDKDAMEKAAREYADIEDTIELANHRPSVDEYKAFKAGWQAAHNGPKVMALVEALKFYQDERNWIKPDGLVCSWAIADTGMRARNALADFEGGK